MGWANCGEDSQGRLIGYAHEARCDHPGCNAKIDRGLSYACGDMHGNDEISCERYFCVDHRQNFVKRNDRTHGICDVCAENLRQSEFWRFDEDEEEFVPSDTSEA